MTWSSILRAKAKATIMYAAQAAMLLTHYHNICKLTLHSQSSIAVMNDWYSAEAGQAGSLMSSSLWHHDWRATRAETRVALGAKQLLRPACQPSPLPRRACAAPSRRSTSADSSTRPKPAWQRHHPCQDFPWHPLPDCLRRWEVPHWSQTPAGSTSGRTVPVAPAAPSAAPAPQPCPPARAHRVSGPCNPSSATL